MQILIHSFHPGCATIELHKLFPSIEMRNVGHSILEVAPLLLLISRQFSDALVQDDLLFPDSSEHKKNMKYLASILLDVFASYDGVQH